VQRRAHNFWFDLKRGSIVAPFLLLD
jgi:hypothetical protein